ncbi:hypothetical protein FB45DRAFT_1039037 [Roridomyces roridus]|uniref:Uncharacterized protein n=1 Tax=Roridomyces roridus TaxID=1738132 RepID=A0AAD7B3X1_9AGAR|nr:hypothetical protein FB45DRAFT_1039037 [Roridomyces roridus]
MPTNGHPDINDYPYFDEQTTWEELQAYDSLVAQGVDLNNYFARHDSMTRVPEDERYLSEMNAEFDEMDIPPASTFEDFGVRVYGTLAHAVLCQSRTARETLQPPALSFSPADLRPRQAPSVQSQALAAARAVQWASSKHPHAEWIARTVPKLARGAVPVED